MNNAKRFLVIGLVCCIPQLAQALTVDAVMVCKGRDRAAGTAETRYCRNGQPPIFKLLVRSYMSEIVEVSIHGFFEATGQTILSWGPQQVEVIANEAQHLKLVMSPLRLEPHVAPFIDNVSPIFDITVKGTMSGEIAIARINQSWHVPQPNELRVMQPIRPEAVYLMAPGECKIIDRLIFTPIGDGGILTDISYVEFRPFGVCQIDTLSLVDGTGMVIPLTPTADCSGYFMLERMVNAKTAFAVQFCPSHGGDSDYPTSFRVVGINAEVPYHWPATGDLNQVSVLVGH